MPPRIRNDVPELSFGCISVQSSSSGDGASAATWYDKSEKEKEEKSRVRLTTNKV